MKIRYSFLQEPRVLFFKLQEQMFLFKDNNQKLPVDIG